MPYANPSIAKSKAAINMNRLSIILPCVLSAYLAGCSSDGPESNPDPISAGSPSSPLRVNAINMRVSPLSPDTANTPSEGLSVRVSLFQLNRPKAVPIPNGKLVFSVHEGRQSKQDADRSHPRLKWTFSKDRLQRFIRPSVIGQGYNIRLVWGNRPPDASYVTISVVYVSDDGYRVSTDPLYLQWK